MGRKKRQRRHPAAVVVVLLLGVSGFTAAAFAYTAAGDRLFPATILLPQIAPGDEFYTNVMTLPLTSSGIGTPTPSASSRIGTPTPLEPAGIGRPNRETDFDQVYAKTITDRLGIFVEETYTRIGQAGAGTLSGWQNLVLSAKYLAVLDPPHEFLFTPGLDRELGDTGARRVGASPSGATTPQLFFGKGFGDLDIGYLRPLAVTGYAGYQASDSRPRPDLAVGGLTLQYSVPYLQSKVQSFELPDVIRGLTQMTEFVFSTPTGKSFGARTKALFGPGVSYAGEGWELAVEALVPATRATGRGIGATAQLHLSLDFLAPDTIGKPLFSSEP
jgi:hypothetical protein